MKINEIKIILGLCITALALITIPAIVSGCKTATPEQQSVTMANLTRAAQVVQSATAAGVAADLLVNTQHVGNVKAAVASLDRAIEAGSLTGGTLAAIVATLPIKADTVRLVSGALLIYDMASVWWMTPESNAGVLLIATALRDGANQGMALAAKPVLRSAAIAGPVIKPVLPAPTSANTRRF